MKILSPAIVMVSLLLSSLNINATSQITVHSGDTMAGLSAKYQVSKVSLEAANHLNNHSDLKVGQKLTLPNSNRPQSQSVVNQNTQDSYRISKSDRSSSLSPTEQAAKNWIAYHESRGKYHVSNGNYYGKYELDAHLLHHDYSPANQEKMANEYVQKRYGSWVKAKEFWQAHDWY